MAAVSDVRPEHQVSEAVWRWEADNLLVRPSHWWCHGRGGGRDTNPVLKKCYLMEEELEASLKEQFQKFNIQFHIIPHTFLMVLLNLILHAEYDHFSLCSPPPNSWPKLLFPIFCIWALSLFLLSSHSILKFSSLISFLLKTKQPTCNQCKHIDGAQNMVRPA